VPFALCDVRHLAKEGRRSLGRRVRAHFPTLQKVPVWVTLSGGDQFVRADFDEIVRLVRTQIEPRIVNIPMNGIITERIFQLLPKIAHNTVGAQLVLNLSVDEIGEAHDRLRGADRNFEKLKLVAELIHDLKKTYPHVVLGVHTVISKFNVHRIPEIEREARALFKSGLVHRRGRRKARRAQDDGQAHHA
jgi:MoaA/NifB/PqqE/SkfB family radical SAM enzyme